MRFQLHHLVSEAARERGDDPALTYKEATLSYAELWDSVRAVSSGLARLEVRRRDRVAVYLDKRVETVASIFGVSAAGGVVVPVNPLFRSRQVGHVLSDCDVRVLVTSAERLPLLREELEHCKSVEHVVIVGGTHRGKSGDRYTVLTWDQLISDGTEVEPSNQSGIDVDMAAILYTSGSTGRPKGVVLSHRNLLVGAESVSRYLGNAASDVILAALPLSFDAGLSQLTTGFQVGAHVVLMNYLLPRDVVRLCEQHQVTGLTGVPPLWNQLAEQDWPVEASRSLRYFANTGGRMPRSTLAKLRRIFPSARPFLMYGLTEAFRSTYLEPSEIDRRPDSIGKAIPNAEVLVVRPDGSPCEPGEEGELVHRGALVAMGYWNDPERTAERFRPLQGLAHGLSSDETAVWSGDTVVRDEDGFLYFVGRKDEMIKTSGYRVSPTEIEEVTYETGLARDAVALGIDDPMLGQRIALAVTPVAGATIEPEALVALLRKQLPQYMIPSTVIVRSELPRSPNGKFDRARLREELTGEVAS